MSIAFHIPFKLENQESYVNLFYIITSIKSEIPDAKIRVGENDTQRRMFIPDDLGIDYFFIPQVKEFSKGLVYNFLAKKAKEDLICNHDNSYILNAYSYKQLMLKFNHKFDCFIASNGYCYDSNTNALEEEFGSIIIYKKDYLSDNPENANLYGFGFENYERKERFRILQTKYLLEEYPCKKLNIGDSILGTKKNPYYPSNANEYKRVMSFDKDNLINYLKN